MATLTGRATTEGTARYRDRMIAQGVSPGHFRKLGDLWVSSIGLGTYLGATNDECDQRYVDAATEAARRGCNLFDSAINYRHQRSERALGTAFAAMESEGIAARDEIVVATKGGYIPFDGAMPGNALVYYVERFLGHGLFTAEEVVGGMHCISPKFLTDQLQASLRNLGLDCVDIYYVQNPEEQLAVIKPEKFVLRMGAAFEMLELAVSEGTVGMYGVATWSGMRVPPDAPDHLELSNLATIALTVGGQDHSFRALQLPYNIEMLEALTTPTQTAPGGNRIPALLSAGRLQVSTIASASLLQGKLGSGLPPEVSEALTGLDSDAQRALQFVRSTPGVTTALIGMSRVEHVVENLAVARLEPAGDEQLRRLFPQAR
jgi:aryl-alcohol dehydrogenase-like predicted oxidoreductase